MVIFETVPYYFVTESTVKLPSRPFYSVATYFKTLHWVYIGLQDFIFGYKKSLVYLSVCAYGAREYPITLTIKQLQAVHHVHIITKV